MCGICGFIERNRNNIASAKAPLSREHILEMMMAALIHRGPDQGKSWNSDR